MKICWFCHETIHGPAERHHRIPKRTYKRGQDHRRNNIVWVHPDCHRKFHREYDDPKITSREHFLKQFESLKLGDGVFAD